MSDIAPLLGKPIPPFTTQAELARRLNVDARRALRDNVVVIAGDIAIVPDTLVVELIANGAEEEPDTTVYGWPADSDDPTVAGRVCLLFRAPT